MKVKSLNPIIIIFIGLFILFLRSVINSTISIYLVRNLDLNKFIQILKNPFNPFNIILSIISYLFLILAGFIVGKLVKKNGIYWAGLTGIIWVLISITILQVFSNPVQFNKIYNAKVFIDYLFIILFTSLGGLFGERFRKSK